jgi:homocysteine S-methyltransferase
VEAEALAKLLSEFPDMPAWISFSCQDERRLCDGELFADGIALVSDVSNVVAAGVNCTQPRFIDGLLASAAGVVHKPLLVYPNSGATWDGAQQCWLGGKGEPDWRASAMRWHAAGARLIGGCCCTTPTTIRQLAGLFAKVL